MSESAAKQRPSIDLDEFERRLRGPSPAAQSHEDPLAELARLVGGGAPFRAPPAGLPKATYQPYVVSPPEWQSQETAAPPVAIAVEPSASHGELPEEPVQLAADPALSYEDEQFSSYGPIETGEDRPPRSRRALYLMSGALVLVLGGIAVTFAMRGHKPAGGEAPTIEAAAGPTKVQPANPGNVDVANQNAALLARSGADQVASSHVVDHHEEPVDLRTIQSQRPAAAGNAANGAQPHGATTVAAPPPAASTAYFPEPKRVHTVSVRPDGTIINNEPGTPAPAPSVVASNDPLAVARAAGGTGSAANPDVPLPVARPVTPKTIARVVTTPKATTATAGAADPATGTPPVPPANIPLKSAPAPAAPIKPVRIADATAPSDANKIPPVSAAVGGGYAVQLAAPASEQEAKDTAARLEKKFASELHGRQTTIEKADSNGRTVYRVRVVGLAGDDANVLCSRLKADGGACFVARN